MVGRAGVLEALCLSAVLAGSASLSNAGDAARPATGNGAPPPAATTTLLARPVLNNADAPARCLDDRQYLDLTQPAIALRFKHLLDAPDPADALLRDFLLNRELRTEPMLPIFTFEKATDYFNHRKELQAKAEKIIAEAPDAQRTRGYENYSQVLLYLGEFEKLIAFFSTDVAPGRPLAESGIVKFSLSEAHYRLGKYQDAQGLAKDANRLMSGTRDTLWHLMVVENALYGRDFYAKYSSDVYTIEHIRELFPNQDWGALPFEDVTEQFGIDRWGGGGSVAWADLDGDGWEDLILQRKYFPLSVYKNVQGKELKAVPEADVGAGICNAMLHAAADIDNDGKLDLVRTCCNYEGPGPRELLKNEGALKFKDATAGSGLDDNVAQSGSMFAFVDYDLDGNVDVLLPDIYGPSHLYRNMGNGKFAETTQKAGVVMPSEKLDGVPLGTVAASSGDYDGDRYPDIFAQGWSWKRLYRNKGDGTFEDVTQKAGIDAGKDKRGYASFFFDYDGDGKLDIFAGQYVVNPESNFGYSTVCTCANLLQGGYTEREWENASTIYRNNGDGTFTDMHQKLRFLPLGVMGASPGDWDNDGDADIIMDTGGPYMQQVEPYLFYENNGDGTFALKTPFLMHGLWGKGHGSAFNDFDHDGDLDLALNNGGFAMGDLWPSLLLRNRGNKNNWIAVALKAGKGTNAAAIGSRVTLTVGGKTRVQELWAAGRIGVSNSFVLHFGLGNATKVDKIVVEWPNKAKTVTTLTDLAADQAIEISETGNAYRKLW